MYFWTASNRVKMDFFGFMIITISLFITACNGNEICRKNTLCSDCVKASNECYYCTSKSFQGSFRCDTEANLLETGCPEPDTYTIKSTVRIAGPKHDGEVLDQTKQIIVDISSAERVVVSSKPGAYSTFTIKYQHTSGRPDIILLHSSLDDKFFKIIANVNCHGAWAQSKRCSGLKLDEIVYFKIDVIMDNAMCKKGSDVATLGISGVDRGIGLYLFPLCGCECDKIENQRNYANHCRERGKLVCGQCQCSSPFSGKTCSCQIPEGTKEADLTAMCTDDNGQICSGRGICECGRCVCSNRQVTGRLCECDNTVCPVVDELPCAGHGQCNCGRCNCQHGWVGRDCACDERIDKCGPPNEVPCNGRGVCQCNRCVCNNGYSGNHCTTAPVVQTVAQPDTKPVTTQPHTVEIKQATSTHIDQPQPKTDDQKVSENVPAQGLDINEPDTKQAEPKPEPKPESEPDQASYIESDVDRPAARPDTNEHVSETEPNATVSEPETTLIEPETVAIGQQPDRDDNVDPGLDTHVDPGVTSGYGESNIETGGDTSAMDQGAGQGDGFQETDFPETTREVHPETVTEVAPERVSEIVPETVSNVSPETVLEVEPETVSTIDQETVSKATPETIPAVDPETVSEVDQETVSNATPETTQAVDPGTVSEVEPETVSEVEPETVSEGEPETVSEVEPEIVPEVEPETVSEVEPENVSQVEPETVSEVDPKTVSEVYPETVSEVDPESVSAVDDETILDIEKETIPEVEPETAQDINLETGPEIDSEKTSEPVREVMAETSPDPETGYDVTTESAHDIFSEEASESVSDVDPEPVPDATPETDQETGPTVVPGEAQEDQKRTEEKLISEKTNSATSFVPRGHFFRGEIGFYFPVAFSGILFVVNNFYIYETLCSNFL